MSPSLLFLTGEYEHKLDSKNRLFIPARLRECIYPERDGLGFFLVFGPNKILGLYPDEYYRRLAVGGGGQLVPGADLVDFERVTFALACHLELDPQNRLTLPAKMVERAQLRRDVVLIGAKDHIEVWDYSKYNLVEPIIKPDAMTREELLGEVLSCYKNYYETGNDQCTDFQLKRFKDLKK